MQVELYQGSVDYNGEIVNGVPVVMAYQGQEDGVSLYTADIIYKTSGLQGLSLRLLPKHKYLSSPYEPRLIIWADPDAVRLHQLNGSAASERNDNVTSGEVAQHPVTI